MARTGFFLSLDGPDGGGKTTQLAGLVDWLRGLGHEVVTCRDPGGTPLGDSIRSILLDRATVGLDIRAEMFLYMASRAQLVAQVIVPALDAGKVVVCDRFLLANVVYQGYAGGMPVDLLWKVGEVATHGLMPDLTVVLDVDPDVAAARVGRPRDRMEDRTEESRARVRDGFLRAAENYPGLIAVIDAGAEPEVVARRLRDEVARALALNPRT
ncbi:dTMP kinase [Isosphaeraceae bacterium EP7]